MSDVEKVARAIPDAAVEKALVAWYAEHGRLRIEWPDGIPSPHRASRANGMRAAIEAALAAMGEREAVAWEHFRDDSYFDLWCVRPTGERAFGVGFHVSTEAEAIALVETLAGKASPRPEAVEGAVKAERERIIAELRRCPHDMGFGREMGPIGCDLDLKEGGCVCMGIAAAIRGGT